MQLMTGGAFYRIHVLDGQSRERLLVHREPRIDHFPRGRAFDDDPVQRSLDGV